MSRGAARQLAGRLISGGDCGSMWVIQFFDGSF